MSVNRTVRNPRNPYANQKVGMVGWTVGTEATNVIKVTAQTKSPRGRAAGRVWGRGWLSDVATGLSPMPTYLMPDGGYALAVNGNVRQGRTPTDCLFTKGTLVIDAVPEKFKTTTTAVYKIGGAQYSKAAATAILFSAAHVVAAAKFGIILVQVNAAGTVSTKVPGATQTTPMAYNTAALALAALPAPDAGKVPLGWITMDNSGSDGSSTGAWVGNTDDLTNTSDITAAAFVDAPENGQYSQFFDFVTSAAGVVDINITHTGIRTFYVTLELPGGELSVSPAVTFA